jgi:bifunctional UDP-N-acetylglucosamine pyrophosphorylase / glucosamine-1-phosphate N-acetyltransferase
MKRQIVVLAAGQGTRMGGNIAKVLVPVLDKPMINHVLDEIAKIDLVNSPVVVVGFQADKVRRHLGDKVKFVFQEDQLGTGHALAMTKDVLQNFYGAILVLYGDHPLISSKTINNLFAKHFAEKSIVTMMTTTIDDFEDWRNTFMSFGRILRNENKDITAIRELKDCTDEEKQINELNPGYYCFDSQWLWQNIDQLRTENNQKEYYLTDLIELAFHQGKKINSMQIDPVECFGVNTPEQLSVVENILSKK